MNNEKSNQYIAEWKRKNVKRINIDFNVTKEKAIYDFIYSHENVSAYIKGLVLQDMLGKKK